MRNSGARDIYKWLKDKYSLFKANIPRVVPASSRKHDAIDIFMKLEIWQQYVKIRGAHMEWAIDPDKLDALEKYLIDGIKDISRNTMAYMNNVETILRTGKSVTISLSTNEE